MGLAALAPRRCQQASMIPSGISTPRWGRPGLPTASPALEATPECPAGLLGRNAAGAVSKPCPHSDPAPPNCSRPYQTQPAGKQLPFAIITAELPSPLHYLLLLPLPWIAGDRDTIKAQNVSFWTVRASFGRKLPLFSPPLPLLLVRAGQGRAGDGSHCRLPGALRAC